MNIVVRQAILCLMQDDNMCQFEYYYIVNEMWMISKDNFGGTSATKLRRFTIKFDSY